MTNTTTTTGIRNIVLVGPAGSGKTSLLEALLFEAGVTKKLGTIVFEALRDAIASNGTRTLRCPR